MKLVIPFYISLIQLIVCILLICACRIEKYYLYILYLHFILRFPFIFFRFQEKKINFLQFFSIIISSIITVFIFAMLFGGFSLKKWLLFSTFIGPVTLSPIYLDGWNYNIYLSLIGLLLGSIPFPLDWPVYWKHPPIPHLILLTLFSFIGSLIDMLY